MVNLLNYINPVYHYRNYQNNKIIEINNNATNELNTIKEKLSTLKKPTVKLSEKIMDEPQNYNQPYIEFKEGEIYFDNTKSDEKSIKEKYNIIKRRVEAISDEIYVKLPDDKTQPVEFVYVVFKGTYYMVLQVGIDKEESTLVIVSINNFDKKDELKQLENDMGVINSIRLYTPERIKYFNAGYENATINFIIKKVLEKYKNEYGYDLTELDSNNVNDKYKINSSKAYTLKHTQNYAFENVVKLCIYNRVLYMCIGINDDVSERNPYPSYDLYLYNMNGTPYTIPGKRSNNLHFQYTGYSGYDGFSALNRGTRSDVFAVNSMKFYTLPTIKTPTQANPIQEVIQEATTGGKKHFMNTRRKSRRTRVGKSKKNRKVVKNRSRRIRM